MVLYLDKNDYAIFNSSDLKNWVMTQKLTSFQEPGNARISERFR